MQFRQSLVALAVILIIVGLGAAGASAQTSTLQPPPMKLDPTNARFLMPTNPGLLLGVYDSGIGPSNDPSWWDTNLFDDYSNLSTIRSTRGLLNIRINAYLNYNRGADSLDQISALMHDLKTHGVMSIPNTNCHASRSYKSYGFTTDGFVYTVGSDPNASVGAYYIMDECDDSLLGETQDHHSALITDGAPLTFAVPIAAGYRDPAVWMQPQTCTASGNCTAASFFGTDPYPLYGSEPRKGYPHFIVADYIARLKYDATTGTAKNPVTAVLQLFKFGGGGRLPTYSEMRMHAYSAIVEGAQGLWWWDIGTNGLRATNTKPKEIQQAMANLQSLVTELRTLEPGLVAPANSTLVQVAGSSPASAISWRKAALLRDENLTQFWSNSTYNWYRNEYNALNQTTPDLSLSPMLKDPITGVLRSDAQSTDVRVRASQAANSSGKLIGYLVAYNYSNANVPMSFTWNSSVSKVVVYTNSGLTVPASSSGTTFGDTFAPYEARLYVITP